MSEAGGSGAGRGRARRPRDPRLDFFRGLAMFIIVFAHTPGNPWTRWIPARFGFSDATEIFVFCSGMASAIAFGTTFASRGWWIGTWRILYRVWQVYWAHVCTFLVIAATMVLLNATGLFERDYVKSLNLGHFFRETEANLVGLLTLSYVPNYFDILPMYLVILAMVPAVMALAHVSRGLLALALAIVWLAANFRLLDLPAEPWSDRTWFFNPFGWQILFFAGFAFMIGWLPAPPVRRDLAAAALFVVLVAVPLDNWPIRQAVPAFNEAAKSIAPLTAKTQFGALRIVHFFALAYLAWLAVGPMGLRLSQGETWPRVVTVIRKVGQQSLAVFVSGLLLSRLLGVMMDVWGRDALAASLINLLGMAIVVGIAYFVGWMRSTPWQTPERAPKSAQGRTSDRLPDAEQLQGR